MAVTSKTLARTSAATSSTTLYTVPNTSTTTIVTNIAITNTGTSAATATINLDGVAILSGVSVSANQTYVIDLKQVLDANASPKTISGLASATTIRFHISGVEIV
jgi:hypothetical protein